MMFPSALKVVVSTSWSVPSSLSPGTASTSARLRMVAPACSPTRFDGARSGIGASEVSPSESEARWSAGGAAAVHQRVCSRCVGRGGMGGISGGAGGAASGSISRVSRCVRHWRHGRARCWASGSISGSAAGASGIGAWAPGRCWRCASGSISGSAGKLRALEAWAASRAVLEVRRAGPSAGRQQVRRAWEAWAASRAVLEVRRAGPSAGQQQVLWHWGHFRRCGWRIRHGRHRRHLRGAHQAWAASAASQAWVAHQAWAASAASLEEQEVHPSWGHGWHFRRSGRRIRHRGHGWQPGGAEVLLRWHGRHGWHAGWSRGASPGGMGGMGGRPEAWVVSHRSSLIPQHRSGATSSWTHVEHITILQR